MLLSISWLLLQTLPTPTPPPAKSSAIVARLPRSFLHVRLEIPGFTEDESTARILKSLLGERAVIVGAIPQRLVSLEVTADRETEKHLTDDEWRAYNLLDSGSTWKLFEAAGLACGEHTAMIEGSGSYDLHAFTVRGGYRFDIHVGESLTAERGAGFSRQDFTSILESFRLAVVRRGTWEQMPAPVLDLMNSALQREDWRSWMEERAKASPEDYAVPFAKAELLRHEEAPPAEQMATYTRAIEILSGKKELSPAEKLAHAGSEDGMALAHLDAGNAAKAIPHLEKSLAIAADLPAPVRAGLIYNLACAHARLAHEEIAIARLLESESQWPGAFQRARIDKDFDAIRNSKRFQEVMEGD